MIKFANSRETILAEATSRTGLTDMGDDTWRTGFDLLVAEMDEAGLSAEGSVAAREQIIANLTARLRAVDGFKAYPAAMARPITRPLIVTGIVRSGTTALHKLLAQDPQFQGPEHWLCNAPQPRPPLEEWPENADFRHSKAALDAMFEVMPEMRDDHGMAVDTVEESLNILAHCFCSNMFPSQFRIPRYDAWYRSVDDTPSYRYLADVLRLIGAHQPDRKWVLKNPTDTFSMRELREVFPDALVVQTHRDPLQSIPSLAHLLRGAHRAFRGEAAIDLVAIFEREQEMWAQAMEAAEEVKTTEPDRVFDVDFRHFVKDQMGTVRAIYAHFDLTLSPAAESAMLAWLNANPRKSGSMQRFTPEDFGCSTDALLERFADYREQYGYTG